VTPRRRPRGWEIDLIHRQTPDPATRAHRGANLCRAALNGTPPDEPATPDPAEDTGELHACTAPGCYRPTTTNHCDRHPQEDL
jgi:hypothetical protein